MPGPVLDHVRIDVTDVDVAARFYRDVFELEVVVCYATPERTIQQMGPGGRPPGVELWMEHSTRTRAHPTEHVGFAVPDVIEVVERARRLGYEVADEPVGIGEETVSFLRDPDGHLVEVNDFRGRELGVGG